MNSATIFFALATLVVSAWGSITPVVVQQEAQPSAMMQQARPDYRSLYAAAAAAEDQKSSASDVAAAGLIQTDGLVRGVNYAVPVAYPSQIVHPLAIAPRLLGGISPAARGFALGGLTGLGLGLGARSLMAGVPLGLGVHSALSTPALGIGLGASAAALLG